MPNIFNIPANYNFLETLACWLENAFGEKLAEVKILLPSRRSCRELQQVFAQKNFLGSLPKIKAISDISYEDFSDFHRQEILDEISKIKVLDGIDQLLFLTSEIQKQQVFGEMNFEHSFKIALHLKDLFEEIEREEIDAKKIYEIDDSNLSQHRQITLEFIKNFYAQIKNSLLKQNILFAAAQQNFLIQQFTKCLESKKLTSPLIIAGSTGSAIASRNLIKTISQQENGFVVLQAAQLGDFKKENHPQFLLNQLIKFLGNAPKDLRNENFKISNEARQNMLSTLMLPSEETLKWQKNILNFDAENFQIIETKNEIEEAKIIAEILSEQKKSALVTNNKGLAKLVRLELKRQSIPFNDARNLDIFDSQLINFLLLILELKEENFNSSTLLALLKNSLCLSSQQQEILAEFEIKILRQDREKSGLEGIIKKLESESELKKFFLDFLKKLDAPLLKAAENLSEKTWDELLEKEPAQKEIGEFFTKLEALNYSANLASEFKMLLGQISYFEKSDAAAQIQILSTIEARLLNFDLVIVASLNEGDFPEIESENWLGKKIKKDLGIDHTLKKIGQNAQDFCNYLSNKSVVLMRSRTRGGVALIESPFLLKFKTLCQKSGITNFEKSKNTPAINAPEGSTQKITNARHLLPKKFSLTEISELISDPYAIYAKKILQLRELQKIDFEPSYAEFGSLVHKALEEFVKNDQTKNFEEIFEKYFLSQEAKLIWWPKFEKIFSDFVRENSKFFDSKNAVEKPIKIEIGEVVINGKIDRVIFDSQKRAQIFDYKTGQSPSRKDVISGIEPQLTIAALALDNEYEIASLNYWKLSYSKEGEIQNISKTSEEIQDLIAAIKLGLERLFAYFSNEKNSYHVTKKTLEGRYRNLARRTNY